VYEQQPRAGGLVRTERIDGFLCEHGPSGFLDNAPATADLIDRLGLGDRVIGSREEARRRYVFRSGRLRELPASPPGLLTSGVLPIAGAVRALAEPFVPIGKAHGDESIRAFVVRRFGRHAADVLADAMVSGIFAGDADTLSLDACFPELPRMERDHGSVVKGLIARGRRPRPRLRSFADGMEALVDALVSRLGGRVHLSSAVARVEAAGGGYRLTLGSGQFEAADAVVLTCGTPAIGRILESVATAPAELAVPSAPMAVVCLGYASEAMSRPLDGFGFLAPRHSGIRALGAVWESSLFPGRAPAGHVLLRVMAGGATDAGLPALDDDALVAAVREDLRRAMAIREAPRFVRVIRPQEGLPQYVLGHPERLRRVDGWLAGHPGLHLGGHSFRGVGVNALVEDAGRIARAIADC